MNLSFELPRIEMRQKVLHMEYPHNSTPNAEIVELCYTDGVLVTVTVQLTDGPKLSMREDDFYAYSNKGGYWLCGL